MSHSDVTNLFMTSMITKLCFSKALSSFHFSVTSHTYIKFVYDVEPSIKLKWESSVTRWLNY